MTDRFAVLGSPIGHSRSPILHRAALDVLGRDADYSAVEVVRGGLADFLDDLDPSWRGLSLTMPLKEEALELADEVDEVARLSSAVNTLLLVSTAGERRLTGFNTDVAGIVRALADADVTGARSGLVLGGGATARSAVVALAQLGAEHVDVVLRDPTRADAVVEVARSTGLTVDVHPFEAAAAALRPDLTISTLPGGAGVEGMIADWSAPGAGALLDVAYHPWPSPLAALWQAAGSTVVKGLAMLLHQAVVQERIWWHGDPLTPLDREEHVLAAMRGALDRA